MSVFVFGLSMYVTMRKYEQFSLYLYLYCMGPFFVLVVVVVHLVIIFHVSLFCPSELEWDNNNNKTQKSTQTIGAYDMN